MEIVTFEIAKIAKKYGMSQNETQLYYSADGKLCNFDYDNDKQECDAITYHQLIDWIFSKVKQSNSEFIDLLIPTLEEWYDLLKDCPLKYEFKGRLLEWFRNNIIYLYVLYDNQEDMVYYQIEEPGNTVHTASKLFETYKEAEHFGILEIFKLLKN